MLPSNNSCNSVKTIANQLPIKGLIFDLDGTLIKSVVDFPKMKHRMIDYLNSLELSVLDYTPKQTTNEIILDFNEIMLSKDLKENERITILEKISEILTEVEFENISKVKLMPGVREFFVDQRFDGIRMGILTRASEKYTLKSLEITGLTEYFKIIATRDEFTLLKAKPNPIALKFVINYLNVPSENIMFVGDHKIDFDCAQAGQVRFAGVLAGAYDRGRLANLGCELLVEDFFELSSLIEEINGN
jgi:HAD superfamily hydrolase (TIGR01549 family)